MLTFTKVARNEYKMNWTVEICSLVNEIPALNDCAYLYESFRQIYQPDIPLMWTQRVSHDLSFDQYYYLVAGNSEILKALTL
jgi:hypothetical protein